MTYLEGQILLSQLWTQFHIGSASNGYCLNKKMFKHKLYKDCTAEDKIEEIKQINNKGEVWCLVELSNQEKVDRAMSSAENHIRQISEMIEHLEKQ